MWEYGDAGDRWPVAIGDIWQLGQHFFCCGDLEQSQDYDFLRHIKIMPQMGIVDPPFSAGPATAFRTKAGQPRKVDFSSFILHLFCALVGFPHIAMMADKQQKYYQPFLDQARNLGYIHQSVIQMVYDRSNPCTMLLFSHEADLPDLPEGLDDNALWPLCIEAFSKPGDWLFDPCVGRGSTALIAHGMQRRFLGMELHPRRLAVTLDRMAQAGAGKPEKIGSLK